MAELDALAENIRRQRKDLDELLENTSTRSRETGHLLEKLQELRARSERSQRAYDDSDATAESGEGADTRKK
jgi:chromosome segregation ATPase